MAIHSKELISKQGTSTIQHHQHPCTSKIKISIELPSSESNLTKNIEIDELGESVFVCERPIFQKPPDDTRIIGRYFKVFSLVMIWLICSVILMANNEKVQDMHQISIPEGSIEGYIIPGKPNTNKIKINLEGALLPPYYENLTTDWISVWVQLVVYNKKSGLKLKYDSSDIFFIQNVSEVWKVPLVTKKLVGHVPEVERKNIFQLVTHKVDNSSYHLFRVQFRTNLKSNFPLSVGYNLQPIDTEDGIVYAAVILVGLYFLMIFDLLHRTLAAMLASTTSIATLAALNERPTMAMIMSWVDGETLLLLFSMMLLVSIFSETGIFDHTAVYAYKLTGGSIWPLINILCFSTALFSCFLDNVTTALLVTPITIRLCEVMKINPKMVLIYTLIFANIGGCVTLIGDPPNVLIGSNPDVIKSGVTFGVFTLHMGVGILLTLIVVYIQIRISYKDLSYYKFKESPAVEGLKREIAVWERTAASVGSYSKDEGAVKKSLLKKTVKLQDRLKTVNTLNLVPEARKESLESIIEDLEKQYPIKDKSLLIKSGITLLLVISVFFLHSIPEMGRLGLGWTAFLGALLLLLLYDRQDIEGILARVEWSTLIFFASLFILMEALARLGLIEWIGKQTEFVITLVGPDARLSTAIILILWVSAVASAFVDNLPLTTMMIRITTDLANKVELNLPLQPLIWSLAFGACLGGNGSLFGSSSNIVCAGIAEQHGYRFNFTDFMKVGLPIMFSSLCVITVYLIICHEVLHWH